MHTPLLAAIASAGLALAACSTSTEGTGGSADDAATLERAVALAPDIQDADLVSGVTVGADGTAVVRTLGPVGRAGVTAVALPGDGTAAVGEAFRLTEIELDLALTAGGETLAVARAGASVGYAVLALDPTTGEVLDTRPIVGTEDVGTVEAALLPDGTVVLAGDRTGGTPILLLVDPATGAVTASAEVPVGGDGDRVQLEQLAASPDGSQVAVALAVRSGDSSPWTPSVAVLGTDLAGPAEPVELDADGVIALAVADDGTAYAAPEAAPGVLAVADGEVREVPADLGEVTGLAVAGGDLVAVDRELTLTRLDPADGTVASTADLCDERGAVTGIAVAPDGALVVVANCAGAGLWVLPG